MATVPEARSHVFGVDFSGGQDAGRKIWVAVGLVNGRKLRVEDCIRGDALPGSGRGLDECLRALSLYIASRPDGVFGLDFPFGLPAKVVRGLYGVASWESVTGEIV